jgi:hypothetical protein
VLYSLPCGLYQRSLPAGDKSQLTRSSRMEEPGLETSYERDSESILHRKELEALLGTLMSECIDNPLFPPDPKGSNSSSYMCNIA